MNKFIVGARAGVLLLTASQYAAAQTVPVKPVAKKVPAEKKVTKETELVAAAKPEGVQWKCELDNEFYITGDMTRDQIIKLYWKGKNCDLPRQLIRTGADRYFDQKTGFDLVVIPAKTMPFGRNEGHRLVGECRAIEMAAGALIPTQAGALYALAGPPLMAPDSPAPAPAPAPGITQPAQ